MNYYNEFDPKAAAWLRALIADGLIPNGYVDERSITDVLPSELVGYAQCHFFAGIGGWAYALQLARWPEGKPVWTGSCPCQPFSQAGKGLGDKDPRHLWPAFFKLIKECRPKHIIGEQVASAIGKGWLDGISADLEAENYSCGSVVLGAHSAGAPHIRQRLYWVANTRCPSNERGFKSGKSHGENGKTENQTQKRKWRGVDSWDCCPDGRLDASESERGCWGKQGGSEELGRSGAGSVGLVLTDSTGRITGEPSSEGLGHGDTVKPASNNGVAQSDTISEGHQGHWESGCQPIQAGRQGAQRHCSATGTWSDYEIVHCRDGKTRRIESGTQCLVDGLPKDLDYRWKNRINEIEKELALYAESTNQSFRQTLREVWQVVQPEYLQWRSGGPDSLQGKAVLHAALCELSRKLGNLINRETPEGATIPSDQMRKMPSHNESSSSPHRREFSEQRNYKFGDLVRKLSQENSFNSEISLWIMHRFPLHKKFPGRAGLLRGYGNAIVPQVAAEFISSYLEILNEQQKDSK